MTNPTQQLDALIKAARDVLYSHDQTGCDASLTVVDTETMKRLQQTVKDITGEDVGNTFEE